MGKNCPENGHLKNIFREYGREMPCNRHKKGVFAARTEIVRAANTERDKTLKYVLPLNAMMMSRVFRVNP